MKQPEKCRGRIRKGCIEVKAQPLFRIGMVIQVALFVYIFYGVASIFLGTPYPDMGDKVVWTFYFIFVVVMTASFLAAGVLRAVQKRSAQRLKKGREELIWGQSRIFLTFGMAMFSFMLGFSFFAINYTPFFEPDFRIVRFVICGLYFIVMLMVFAASAVLKIIEMVQKHKAGWIRPADQAAVAVKTKVLLSIGWTVLAACMLFVCWYLYICLL